MKGLPNFGNTCYFNAALQCLLQVPPLSNYFLKTEGSNDESPFVTEYRRLARQYWSDDPNPIDPSTLLTCIRTRFKQFDGADQQDAQEVIMCMFELFDATLMKQIFWGRTVQETLCRSGKSNLAEEFYSIVLYPSTNCSVTEALEEYQKYATIQDYQDSKGDTTVSVSRTLFWNIPRVFILSFQNRKRITITPTIRITLHKDAPLQTDEKTLFALIRHQGSQHSGHYTAFTNHCGTWFYKDDTLVTQVSPPETDYYYLALYK